MEHESQVKVEERPYLSIGDVLDILRDEFPEITISKIRFLESQGLINPERTPSGYRKFFEEDVERLKWVLRQQREHYLPLKVIKGKLEGRIPHGTGDLTNVAGERPIQPVQRLHRQKESQNNQVSIPAGQYGNGRERVNVDVPSSRQSIGIERTGHELDGERATGEARVETERAEVHQSGAQRSRSEAVGSASEYSVKPSEPELVSSEGASSSVLKELESYGLISGERIGGVITYGTSDAEISSIASRIMEYGFEARHLKVFRHAVDREVSIIEQAIVPLLRQRNPKSLDKAKNSAKELLELSEKLHGALMRAELNRLFPPGN